MFIHFLTITFRNFRKNIGNSILNAIGLSISIVVSLYILYFVNDELNYDRYHKDSNRIYRAVVDVKTVTGIEQYATTPPPLAPILVKDFPQIEYAVRFFGNPRMPVRYGAEKIFYESRFYYVDPNVFSLFDIPFVKGNAKTALQRPGTVVITEATAHRYFGDEEPLGKLLRTWRDFEVTGVVKNIPRNSHLQFEFLSSSELFASKDWMKNWGAIYAPSGWNYTYVKLHKGGDIEGFKKQIKDIAYRYYRNEMKKSGLTQSYDLQKIKDIHLKSQRRAEAEPPGSLVNVAILSAISIFLILIVCFNFINLAIAQSAFRVKEISIRKAVGAQKSLLIVQFFSESILLILTAYALAVVVMELALPWFNDLSGKEFRYTFIFTPAASFIMIAVILLVGLTAASYPAFFMSSFMPTSGFRRKYHFRSSSHIFIFRRLLITFQFAISVVLIVGTITMMRQFRLMNNHPLGFDKAKMLVLNVPLSSVWKLIDGHETIKKEFSSHSTIISACVSSSVPGRDDITHYQDIRVLGENRKIDHSLYALLVDHDFFNTYKIKLQAGRTFNRDLVTDEGSAILINETAVKEFGWTRPEEAIGKRLDFHQNELEIIGVCGDFHFQSLHKKVEPLFMDIFPDCFTYITLALNTQNLSETMAFIKEKWDGLFQGELFDYFFLDDMLDQQYRPDRRFNQIILIFTILAIGIASLGLFGITSLVTERRTKEIGIRKVLGSSVPGIVYLLVKETIIGVILANVIAWPIAWYAMNKWLQNFAYRIDLTIWPFLLAGMSALIIALLTVSWQAIRAATANPVEALRYE